MKTKIYAGLAMTAALLISGPAFGKDHPEAKANAGGHHEAVAVHHGGGAHAVAMHHGGGSTHAVAVHRGGGAAHVVAASRPAAHRGYASSGHHSTTAVAYSRNGNFNHGGSSHVSYNNNGNYHHGDHGSYAFASHSGWSRGHEYDWHGNHYRWYDNGWFIVAPTVGYVASAPVYYNTGGGSVSAEVQSALSRQGYYQGPIDGLVGPGTRSAIAAYQQDNGLSVTGTITNSLLNNLGV